MGPHGKDIEAKPYPGANSFQVEDQDLFFGRDREAEQLVAMVISNQSCLLHALSGAGKTSLLNARLIPYLERRGSIPIRILPQNHPIESIRVSTLEYVLPPPGAEETAIRNALDEPALAPSGQDLPPADWTLAELRDAFRSLRIRDKAKRELIAPIEGCQAPRSLPMDEFGAVTPYFSRWLRGSISLRNYWEHLWIVSSAAVDRHLGSRIENSSQGTDIRLRDLEALFRDDEFLAAYDDLFDLLYLPLPGLEPFFGNLREFYGQYASEFELVLILDQFEELFTRFVGPEPGALTDGSYGLDGPNWRQRRELFHELGQLCGPAASVDQLRVLISMRNEYIAELDQIIEENPSFVIDDEYHLKFLDPWSAGEAIREPAELFGYRYAEECYEQIIEQLTQESRYVQPAHIQIVCEKLWKQSGKDLSAEPELPEIPVETFLRVLGGTEGILQSYFTDFLDELKEKFRERRRKNPGWLEGLTEDGIQLEVLEMLEPLRTRSNTRNIVAKAELIDVPFRRKELREWLLHELSAYRIVRVEKRLGGLFAEITHEFLIGPIQRMVDGELVRDPSYGRFLEAFIRLRNVEGDNFRRTDTSPLRKEELEALFEHQGRLDWGYLGSEQIFRYSILAGLERAHLAAWSARVRGSDTPHLGRLLRRLKRTARERFLLSRDELDLVNAQRDQFAGQLDGDQLEAIFESQLLKGESHETEDIVVWAERLAQHGAESR